MSRKICQFLMYLLLFFHYFFCDSQTKICFLSSSKYPSSQENPCWIRLAISSRNSQEAHSMYIQGVSSGTTPEDPSENLQAFPFDNYFWGSLDYFFRDYSRKFFRTFSMNALWFFFPKTIKGFLKVTFLEFFQLILLVFFLFFLWCSSSDSIWYFY